MPYALDALLAEIWPVRRAFNALFNESSFQDLVGPSFFGVSMPRRWARCHSVVDGMPYVMDAFVRLILWLRSASNAESISSCVHVFGLFCELFSFCDVKLVYCGDERSVDESFIMPSSLVSDSALEKQKKRDSTNHKIKKVHKRMEFIVIDGDDSSVFDRNRKQTMGMGGGETRLCV